jgi:glycerophosphoryl diester phosphodiesterase
MHRPWPHARVIAHRGGGALAPENTLAGIRKAAQMGFRCVEFDVMLSADKVPLLIHDETLDRTTDGRGAVAETPYANIARLDAGGWFGDSFRGEPLPTFALAGGLCVDLRLWANVELKPARGYERETGELAATLARKIWREAPQLPLFSSFHPNALEAARTAAPEFQRGFLTEQTGSDTLEAARGLGCVSIHCNGKYLTAAEASRIHHAGFWLLCYTVNELDRAKLLFSWGVDAIFTDRLDLLPPDLS